MKVFIDSLEIYGTDRHGRVEVEIEFYDNKEVIDEFGLKETLSHLDEDDVLNEIGWLAVKKFFSEEIEEEVKEALNRGD